MISICTRFAVTVAYDLLAQVENELSKSNKWSKRDAVDSHPDKLGAVVDPVDSEPLHERFRELERRTVGLCRVLNEERKNWDQERLKWFQEKEKVLCYQRQLQMNYVQMFRRTQAFEAQIENLTVQMNVCSDHCSVSGTKNVASRKATVKARPVNAIKLWTRNFLRENGCLRGNVSGGLFLLIRGW